MRRRTLNGKPLHSAAEMYIKEFRQGRMSRRDFMAYSTTFGLTAAAAGSIIGARPARAGGHIQQGGTLRIQMEVHGMTEPRIYQWSEMGNQTRGLLEHLVHYNRDGSFTPVLLESWEINEDATEYRLNLRQGVKWNNGDDFTSADVAANFEGWCDTTVEGSSMPGRMGSLVDPDTGVLRTGALETPDDHTVVLKLPTPDITIIAGIADYPAAVVHRSKIGVNHIDEGGSALGTGAYMLDDYSVGEKSVWVKNPNHNWWNADNGAYLDRVEFIDYGTDPATILAAVEAEEVDMVYETVGDFVDILDGLGLVRSEAETAATIICRPNAIAEINGMKPYEDVRVRKALAMAVDNSVVLELGYAGRGKVAENHHVSPIHPAYAELPPLTVDPAGAAALMEEAGMMDFEHEIHSLDDGWERDSTDAIAAQLRDAGFNVKRTVLPGSTYWNDWQKYPFSSTTWNQRPFGTQVLTLAYTSNAVWNETGFANEEFDRTLAEANAIADADQRREKMRRLEEIMQEEGVIIQPFWRSIYNHSTENVVNADMHPQFEIKYQHIGLKA